MPLVLVCPAAPGLLPDVSPDVLTERPEDWDELRDRVHATLAALEGATTIISLVAGDETTVANGGVADLRAYGVTAAPSTHRGDHDVAAVLHDVLDLATRERDDAEPRHLPLDAAVHVRLAAEHGARSVIAVQVGPDRVDDVAAALDAVFPVSAEHRGDLAVVVQGDLASSPIRRTDSDRGTEAAAWDERALPLLQAGDVDGWRGLDPGDVEPRGLAPLAAVLTWLGDRFDGHGLAWSAPRGIGAVAGVVAHPGA